MTQVEQVNSGIVIAHIARMGNRGEVTAEILTDFPERFDEVARVTSPGAATPRPCSRDTAFTRDVCS
jgi:hypothetical protein